MTRRNGFTLIELLVVISIIVLLLALLLPALMGARRSARQQQNATRLKSLGDGMKRYADGNRDQFPGLTPQGAVTPVNFTTLSGPTGDTPVTRIAILFAGAFAQPDDAINPIDSAVEAYRPSAANAIVQVRNFSFAMLDIRDAPTGAVHGRKMAWSRDVNALAPLMADRNTGNNAVQGSNVSSVWEEYNKGNWSGSVCWGDLSVRYENSHVLETEYPGGITSVNDNLFNGEFIGGQHYVDARMVYQNNASYVAQRP